MKIPQRISLLVLLTACFVQSAKPAAAIKQAAEQPATIANFQALGNALVAVGAVPQTLGIPAAIQNTYGVSGQSILNLINNNGGLPAVIALLNAVGNTYAAYSAPGGATIPNATAFVNAALELRGYESLLSSIFGPALVAAIPVANTLVDATATATTRTATTATAQLSRAQNALSAIGNDMLNIKPNPVTAAQTAQFATPATIDPVQVSAMAHRVSWDIARAKEFVDTLRIPAPFGAPALYHQANFQADLQRIFSRQLQSLMTLQPPLNLATLAPLIGRVLSPLLDPIATPNPTDFVRMHAAVANAIDAAYTTINDTNEAIIRTHATIPGTRTALPTAGLDARLNALVAQLGTGGSAAVDTYLDGLRPLATTGRTSTFNFANPLVHTAVDGVYASLAYGAPNYGAAEQAMKDILDNLIQPDLTTYPTTIRKTKALTRCALVELYKTFMELTRAIPEAPYNGAAASTGIANITRQRIQQLNGEIVNLNARLARAGGGAALTTGQDALLVTAANNLVTNLGGFLNSCNNGNLFTTVGSDVDVPHFAATVGEMETALRTLAGTARLTASAANGTALATDITTALRGDLTRATNTLIRYRNTNDNIIGSFINYRVATGAPRISEVVIENIKQMTWTLQKLAFDAGLISGPDADPAPFTAGYNGFALTPKLNADTLARDISTGIISRTGGMPAARVDSLYTPHGASDISNILAGTDAATLVDANGRVKPAELQTAIAAMGTVIHDLSGGLTPPAGGFDPAGLQRAITNYAMYSGAENLNDPIVPPVTPTTNLRSLLVGNTFGFGLADVSGLFGGVTELAQALPTFDSVTFNPAQFSDAARNVFGAFYILTSAIDRTAGTLGVTRIDATTRTNVQTLLTDTLASLLAIEGRAAATPATSTGGGSSTAVADHNVVVNYVIRNIADLYPAILNGSRTAYPGSVQGATSGQLASFTSGDLDTILPTYFSLATFTPTQAATDLGITGQFTGQRAARLALSNALRVHIFSILSIIEQLQEEAQVFISSGETGVRTFEVQANGTNWTLSAHPTYSESGTTGPMDAAHLPLNLTISLATL